MGTRRPDWLVLPPSERLRLSSRALPPTDRRQALEDVSADHLLQPIHNEWPWLTSARRGWGARTAARTAWSKDEVHHHEYRPELQHALPCHEAGADSHRALYPAGVGVLLLEREENTQLQR